MLLDGVALTILCALYRKDVLRFMGFFPFALRMRELVFVRYLSLGWKTDYVDVCFGELNTFGFEITLREDERLGDSS